MNKADFVGAVSDAAGLTKVDGAKAVEAFIETVIIPDENVKDLADIPKNVTESLSIRPVRWIDEVLDIALERPLTPQSGKVQEEPKVATEPAPAAPTDITPVRPH